MRMAQDYFQRGTEHQIKGELSCAKRDFQAALVLDPVHVNAMNYLGVMEASEGNHVNAVNRFSWIVLICNVFAPFYLNLANSLFGLERYAEAERSYTRCLELDLGCLVAYYRRGLSRHFSNKNESAIKDVLVSIIIDPSIDEYYYHSGIFWQSMNEKIRAEESYRRSGILSPLNSMARCNYGSTLSNSGRTLEALPHFICALISNPGFYDAWYNAAVGYREISESKKAIMFLERAISIKRDEVKAQCNYGLYLLEACLFETGWQQFDTRWKDDNFDSKPFESIRPYWAFGDGSSRVLVWGEQGIGDVILFSSMLSELERNTSTLIVAVIEKLVPLFQRSWPTARIVGYKSIPSYVDYDAHLSMGMLGRYFRPDIDSFKNNYKPYLVADKEKARLFRSRVSSGAIVCGISWHSTRASVGSYKSIVLEDLLPILTLENVVFVSLQYGDVDEEIKGLNERYGTRVEAFSDIDKYSDIDGLTSLVDMCDLVITVSNTTAHIAGALSKQTALLTPAGKGKIWYWGNRDDGQSLWYPAIKFFDQDLSKDWTSPILAVRDWIMDACESYRTK